MSDNPFGDRLRWIEAKEKMDEAEKNFYDSMLVGHNYDMPLEFVVERLLAMTLRLLKGAMGIANERDKRRNTVS